jgi:hypothetical protein
MGPDQRAPWTTSLVKRPICEVVLTSVSAEVKIGASIFPLPHMPSRFGIQVSLGMSPSLCYFY